MASKAKIMIIKQLQNSEGILGILMIKHPHLIGGAQKPAFK